MNKLLIAIATVLVSSISFAGPEEHKDAQTCFVPEKQVIYAPERVCIETVNVDLTTDKITVYSYFNYKLTEGFVLTNLVRKNEDWFRFKALNNISQFQTLELNGLVNNWGEADFYYLTLTLIDTQLGEEGVVNYIKE